ncbi:MAG TPA: AI-2E family transporter [Trinickia sp.]|jgi:predicted PurR-regulated permease PerM|nr:AI-2E family transporter [Trinickia sp.]
MSLHPPAESKPIEKKKMQRTAALVLYAALVVLAIWVMSDFIAPVVWAAVIAIALWPALLRISAPRHGRVGATVIALALTLAVGLFVVLPIVFVFTETLGQLHDVIAWFRGVEANGIPVPDFVTHLPHGSQIVAWWQANLARPWEGSPAMQGLHGGAVATAGRHFGVIALRGIIHFGFMLLVLFVLLQAGPRLADQMLAAVRNVFGVEGAQLAIHMAAAVRGTVAGLIVVGLGEGALIGVAYVLSGLPHPAELGLLTAVAAMLPFLAPVVFIGAALWLLTHGSVTGAIAVFATGSVVVFVADHFVRPAMIGSAARLPFLLVLFGILGGAQTFGLVGLFIGPALMTVLVVLWREAVR